MQVRLEESVQQPQLRGYLNQIGYRQVCGACSFFFPSQGLTMQLCMFWNCVVQAGLKFTEIYLSAFDFCVLGLKVCALCLQAEPVFHFWSLLKF